MPTAPLRMSRLASRVLSALALLPLLAHAGKPVLPSGPTVVHGQARIDTTGQAMTVTAGRNSAIDWRSFSIGPQASVRFDQPDASSKVLNRVLGRDPSQVLGRLSSNGEVWLINPHGVLFGRDARVDVAGLVASSLNLSIADWAAGRRTLAPIEGVPSAEVANAGTLRSSTGGRIVLVGGGVVNDGTIEAPQGHIDLRAASRVDLADSTWPDISVRLTAQDTTVTNRGSLLAPGGVIDLQAAMVNQSGVLRADGIAGGPGGTVTLRAGSSLQLDAGSLTSAVGAPGGRIDLLGGTQLVRGRVDAGSATGLGGQLNLAAPRIALLDGAALQVDGALGGGQVRLGLPLAAGAAEVPAAQAVFVGADARISADALQAGDGGDIRLWSDGATRAFGRFSARGGATGGDGGLIETSGVGLQARPALVDTQAPKGRAGTWLLDPLDVQIVQASHGPINVGPGPDFSATAPGATIDANTILTALASSDVSISTGTSGTDAGTISMTGVTLDAPLAAAERTLTLDAASSIRLDRATIVSDSGRLNLRLLAGPGAKDGIMLNNTRIDVRGDLTMRGAEFATTTSTVRAQQIDLRASRVALGTPITGDDVTLPTLSARGTGNSLTVRGLVDNVDTFTSGAGTDALSTDPGGRWLLYARDPAATSVGGLAYAFKQYGATFPAAAAGTGNGLLYALQPVLSITAADLPLGKTYDGGTTLTLTASQLGGITLTGFLPGDVPTTTTGVIGRVDYDSRDVGRAVPITASLSGPLPLVFEGKRPVFGYAFSGTGLSGSIELATLTYHARPVTVAAGAGLPALNGTVTGFMPGDSQATATTGALGFTSSAGAAPPPGAHPLVGGGLDAINYRLVQDPANASALRILPAESDDASPPASWPRSWPEMDRTRPTERVDVVTPISPGGFAPLDFPGLSPVRLDAEIRSRNLALERAFGASKAMLDADPALARLPDCADVAGALQGTCIVTPELKVLVSSLWTQHATWSGMPPGVDRDRLFDRVFWIGDIESAAIGQPGRYMRGDGSFSLSGPPLSLPVELMLTQQTQMLISNPGSWLPGGTAADMTAPPAVIVAAAPTPAQLLAIAPPRAGQSTVPSCITPRQRLSGECQRQAELEALREALERCALRTRDEQPACLFSERVKLRLQQREQEGHVLSAELQSREARRSVLPGIRRKWAMVIGVGHYPKVELGGQPVRMPSAENDARAIARELRDGFGYITSELVNPTRAQVVQRLNMLAAIAQPSDSMLVFFSGYGFTIAQGDDAVWAMSDADPKDGRTVLSHADLARLLELLDARQVALISDSTLAGRLRVKAVDYDPKAAPDASGLLGRRATVALTSGGNLPLGSVAGQGLSDFASQLVSVLRRVTTWHVGGRIFREVQTPLIQAGRPFVPQYGAASETLHQLRGDYLFERRELERDTSATP